MIRYKLTDRTLRTHRGYQWTVGEWHEVTGDPAQPLCTDGWLHCYETVLLAVLHNPIHADIANPRLWEVEVEGECLRDGQVKEGWRRMRLVREIDVPKITMEQRVRYGILVSLQVYDDPDYRRWAEGWLSDKDRSEAAAWAAAQAAKHNVGPAASASAASWAARGGRPAKNVAESAAVAAWAATRAADIDLAAIAEEACL